MDFSTYASLMATTALLAPLLEETVFRGFLLTSLTKWDHKASRAWQFLPPCARCHIRCLPAACCLPAPTNGSNLRVRPTHTLPLPFSLPPAHARWMPVPAAVALSSVAFGMVHLTPRDFPQVRRSWCIGRLE